RGAYRDLRLARFVPLDSSLILKAPARPGLSLSLRVVEKLKTKKRPRRATGLEVDRGARGFNGPYPFMFAGQHVRLGAAADRFLRYSSLGLTRFAEVARFAQPRPVAASPGGRGACCRLNGLNEQCPVGGSNSSTQIADMALSLPTAVGPMF